MTIGEVERAIKSKQRLLKIQAQEKASFDYIQALLIAKVVHLGSDGELPEITEVYPSLFNDDETKQAKIQEKKEKVVELSALRFKQFANSYNKRYKEAAKEIE